MLSITELTERKRESTAVSKRYDGSNAIFQAESGLFAYKFPFFKIVRHVRKVYTMRFANGILDSVLVKYCATMTAY